MQSPGMVQPNRTAEDSSWDGQEEPVSPKIQGPEDYQKWAEGVVYNLCQALGDSGEGGSQVTAEQVTVAVLTRRIARQVAMQIPRETLANLVTAARSKMRVVEDSCLEQMFEADGADGANDTADAASGGASSSKEELQTAISYEMADILTRRIPQELSRCIAKKIFAKLTVSEGDDDNSDPGANSSSEEEVDEYKEGEPFSDEEGDRASYFDERRPASDDTASAASKTTSSDRGTGIEEEVETGRPSVRKPSVADVKATQRAAFVKFKRVLTVGNGFRVVKHNHGGGRKIRVLRYNPIKNTIYWESSKILGAETISCGRVVQVHREGTVLYIWHMKGGVHGSVKKMVGFEAQREADAAILENALMFIMDKGHLEPEMVSA